MSREQLRRVVQFVAPDPGGTALRASVLAVFGLVCLAQRAFAASAIIFVGAAALGLLSRNAYRRRGRAERDSAA